MRYVILLVAVFAVLLAACGSPKFEDLTTVESDDGGSSITAQVRDADSVTVYRNIDQFANINVMCVNGDALVTRSVSYTDYFVIHLAAGNHNLCG